MSSDLLMARISALCEIDKSLTDEEIISCLRSRGLISHSYDITCLMVDRWFISREENLYKRYSVGAPVDDPYIRIFLETLIYALIDYARGRPCDAYSWEHDQPPDSEKCLFHAHICRDDAEKFLRCITPEIETSVGLSPGTVYSYMRILNGKK